MAGPDSSGVDLAYAIGLEPTKAMEYLEAKGVKVSGAWSTMLDAAHAKAFTVANVTRADVVQDILDAQQQALKSGLTLRQFQDNLVPTLTRKGWFAARGEPVRVPDGTAPDPQTGELATRKRLTARRLQTIYQVNMQSSMMAGRWRELQADVDNRPWFQYVAILDGRTRPAHRAMHGRVFRHDDAFWSTGWPPCGWNCRCRARARSDADLADAGLTPESSAGRLRQETVDLANGSTATVTRYTAPDGRSFAPDPGFNSNPALVQAADRLAITRCEEVLPAAQSQAELRRLFTAPQRLADLRNFAAAAREAPPVGAVAGVGALDEAATFRLVDEGVRFDRTVPVVLEDRLIATPTPLEDWGQVPRVVAFGELLWDAAQRTLVYVAPAVESAAAGELLRVVVRPGLMAHVVQDVQRVRRPGLRELEALRGAIEPEAGTP
jgi:SPP1 gp7 family putative phage head morphogenesis protein